VKTALAVLAIMGGIYYLTQKITPEMLMNRAIGNMYRSSLKRQDWYR
jgi:hypothetical protein